MNSIESYEFGLVYYSAIFDENELVLLESNLNKADIGLIKHDKTGRPQACLDLLVNQISIKLNEPIIQAILTGVISCTIYDILKNSIISLWKSSKGKKLNIYQGGEIKEQKTTIGLDLRIHEAIVNFRLPEEISDSQREECLDSMFNFMKMIPSNLRPSVDYAVYNIETKTWNFINILEEIKKVKSELKS